MTLSRGRSPRATLHHGILEWHVRFLSTRHETIPSLEWVVGQLCHGLPAHLARRLSEGLFNLVQPTLTGRLREWNSEIEVARADGWR